MAALLIVLIAILAIPVAVVYAKAQQQRARDELLRQSELAVADAMTGQQFERYFADLLKLRGYRSIQVVGKAGDGGIDILATDPTGSPVACQCKRQVANVSVQVVRQLIGSVHHEHMGRVPYLATTAALTKPAASLAAGAGVQVIDRQQLGYWMADARRQLTATAPTAPAATAPATGFAGTASAAGRAAGTQPAPSPPVSTRPQIPLSPVKSARPPVNLPQRTMQRPQLPVNKPGNKRP